MAFCTDHSVRSLNPYTINFSHKYQPTLLILYFFNSTRKEQSNKSISINKNTARNCINYFLQATFPTFTPNLQFVKRKRFNDKNWKQTRKHAWLLRSWKQTRKHTWLYRTESKLRSIHDFWGAGSKLGRIHNFWGAGSGGIKIQLLLYIPVLDSCSLLFLILCILS